MQKPGAYPKEGRWIMPEKQIQSLVIAGNMGRQFIGLSMSWGP